MAQKMSGESCSISKKRKGAPPDTLNAKAAPNKRPKIDPRARQRDARTLKSQTSSKAFQNGALDVSAFVKAREYEIHALERGMSLSGQTNNRRAFQQVPKDLRRRTASHNAKKVPKRLRPRAEREMIEDNTPTVTARRRKPTSHMRLRMETVKKLRALGARKKAVAGKGWEQEAPVSAVLEKQPDSIKDAGGKETSSIGPRRSKVKKKAALATPPIPKAKFRKRQVHKSWLPTHLFHTKRAHMTPPSAPLWRLSIPLTPTQKIYRHTHRASRERGAVAWDVSYTSTIALEGKEGSILNVLRGLSVEVGKVGDKWRKGMRARETWVHERESRQAIAPAVILWSRSQSVDGDQTPTESDQRKRMAVLRVHPSAFFQIWEEVVRLAKVAKPAVVVEDLRFEIGAIEITGPGSTEALLGVLWPTSTEAEESNENTWTGLAGLTNPSSLPGGALLAFNVHDPRLHHPPRTIKLPQTQEEHQKLLELIAKWPPDRNHRSPTTIFDPLARRHGSKLSSQKAVNRRRSLAAPGVYPATVPTDPQIPVLLYTSPSHQDRRGQQSSWTVLAPWRTVQPIWYSIQYYPLSTGSQPRFGGLNETRQLAFEAGQAWFPADYPGTKAGWEWEMTERKKRLEEWQRRQKSKRVSWERVDLGNRHRGEVGLGWACDWELLLKDKAIGNIDLTSGEKQNVPEAIEKIAEEKAEGETKTNVPLMKKPDKLNQLTSAEATRAVTPPFRHPEETKGQLITVRLTLLTRGVPQTCARIYRLPTTDTAIRNAWLGLQPSKGPQRRPKKNSLPKFPKDAPAHVIQQRLARTLLQPPQAGEEKYPACPGEEDLMGFVTTGNFNLAEGKGTGIGCLMVSKVIENMQAVSESERTICIVRNAGESIGRLARWEVVE